MELVSLFRTEPELSKDLDIDPFLFVSFFCCCRVPPLKTFSTRRALAMFMQQMGGGGGEPSCPVS